MARPPPRVLAKYLYADNHQYSSNVIEQVYNAFIKTVQHIEHVRGEIQLSYDHELHAFSLSCPTILGPMLHENMEAVLARCRRHHVSDNPPREGSAPVELIPAAIIPPTVTTPSNKVESVAEQIAERAFPWDFAGKRVTVEQWIAGMGDTVQVPPDTRPQEPPMEHEHTLCSLQTRQPAVGRIRLPAQPGKAINGAGLIKQLSDERGPLSGPSSIESAQLPVPRHFASTRGDSDSDDVSSAEVDIADLLGQTKISTKDQSIQSQLTPRSTQGKARIERSYQGQDGGSPMGLRSSSQHTSPPVRRSYGKIDSHGLAGRADAQAQWDLENGISPISAPLQQAEAVMPDSDNMRYVQRYAWESNVVPNQPLRSETLVDVAVNIRAHDQFPPITRRTKSKARSKQPMAKQRASKQRASKQPVPKQSVPKQPVAVHLPLTPSQAHLSHGVAQLPHEMEEEDMITFSDTTEFFSARSSSPDADEQSIDRLAAANQGYPRR